MKKILIFFLFVSNFVFSQNPKFVKDLKSSEAIDIYCNLISKNKSLKVRIGDGEISDSDGRIIGGLGIETYFFEGEKVRVFKEESVNKESKTIDCYFYNNEIIKVIVKNYKSENKSIKNISTSHYYFFGGKLFRTFGEKIQSEEKIKKEVEDVIYFSK